MSGPNVSSIAELVDSMRKHQANARTYHDIESALRESSALLRGASKELGRIVAPHYYLPSARLDFIGLDNYLGCAQLLQSDSSYHVYCYIHYALDPTIDLDLILASIPEMGLSFDTDYRYTNSADSERRMFLCPTKWPIAACMLLKQYQRVEHSISEHMDKISSQIFPQLPHAVILFAAELCSCPQELCDYLLALVASGDTEADTAGLPADIMEG